MPRMTPKPKRSRKEAFPVMTIARNESSDVSGDYHFLKRTTEALLAAQGEARVYAGGSQATVNELYHVKKSRASKRGLKQDELHNKAIFSFSVFVRTTLDSEGEPKEFSHASISHMFDSQGCKITHITCNKDHGRRGPEVSKNRYQKIQGRQLRITAECGDNATALLLAYQINEYLLGYAAEVASIAQEANSNASEVTETTDGRANYAAFDTGTPKSALATAH
ncbi:hypothetical protein FWG76_00325 [Candidatus Saccharibacteria bacterium]|nr:hypothetical protein [Candidatus Saccharibacteria bacterium]